ncbi:hypothetical protein FO440_11450 [Mucilaginibacter corticis]|uniref:Uncharacterized protein n=1 Tax=Mucilaginibacter corticis TaxID=2597670 RepID=A0A556MKE2_9SPHI|nr:hypothetical protein [Mucilaginibacter corticis]TSJ40367.1 hypothetical protein FO440_11450 [Mucilaginibacter corticis]
MGRKIQKPFFYFEELSDGDKLLIGIYSFFTVALLFIWLFGSTELKWRSTFFYEVIPQLAIIFGLYISIRNFKAYLIWMGFGLVHLLVFIYLTLSGQTLDYNGHMGVGINTVLLLLLFQGLRYFSLKFQHREFVNPAKSYSYTKPYAKDFFEKKKFHR